MAFCKFCGKEIPEGSVCDCPGAQAENTPAENSPAEGAPAAKPSNTANIIIIAGLVIVLLVILGIVSAIAGGGYKKPVKNFEKALNKCDGELIAEAMLTDDMIDELDDDIDELDDMLEMLVEFAEDEYGKNVKFSIDINDKEKLDKDELEDIADEYEDQFDEKVKISKGYELDVTIKVKGKDGKDEEDSSLYVIKIKGEGWKLAADSIESLF